MTCTAARRPGGGGVRALAALATFLVTAGTVSACTGHSDAPPKGAAPSSPTSSPAAVAPLTVRSGVTRVVGEMSPDARKRLAARAGALVEAYFRAAFLRPHTARVGGPASFPGFTPEARALAEHDRAVLTGADYAGADRVDPQGGTAYVNVLAPHGHVVGATVRVSLALSVTAHGHAHPVAVSGRLLITPTAQGWRVFGYDLAQSGRHARSAP